MTIRSAQKLEDCFDGSSVWRYVFDQAWARTDILRLAELGRLDFFPEFPRPFFRLAGACGIQVKGIEGEDSCQVILPRREREAVRERFERHFTAGAKQDHTGAPAAGPVTGRGTGVRQTTVSGKGLTNGCETAEILRTREG